VLIRENLRRNIVHARPDRVVCRFETMTLDTPANRILKWALLLATRFMAQYGANIPEALWDWARSAGAALSPVSEVPVGSRDFLGIHYGGLMQRYRKIHALARMIIRRLRSDAEGTVQEIKGQTVPFWLDMNALFEGYVGVLLQRAGRKDFSAQTKKDFGDGKGLTLKTRPDYITDDGSIVVDAKYKGLFEDADANGEGKGGERVELKLEGLPGFKYQPSNQDLYQIIAYSTLFAGAALSASGALSKSRRAFLAVPVVATQSIGEQLLPSWRRALDKDGFAGDPLVPSFKAPKAPISAEHELLVGVLPTPLPVKEAAA
jgi:5-methylcytosine-specific restriction endonuclease McrBC regulatory subunit McrC